MVTIAPSSTMRQCVAWLVCAVAVLLAVVVTVPGAGVMAQEVCSTITSCSSCQDQLSNTSVPESAGAPPGTYTYCVFCAVGQYGSCVPWITADGKTYDLPGKCSDSASYWRRVYHDFTCPADSAIDDGGIVVSYTDSSGNSVTFTTGTNPSTTENVSRLLAILIAAAYVIAEVGFIYYRHNLAPGAAESKTPAALPDGASFSGAATTSDSEAHEAPVGGSSGGGGGGGVGGRLPPNEVLLDKEGKPRKKASKFGKIQNIYKAISWMVTYPIQVILTIQLTYTQYTIASIKAIPCNQEYRPGCTAPDGVTRAAPFVLLFGLLGLVATAVVHAYGFYRLDLVANKPVGYPFRMHLAKIAAIASEFSDMYILFMARQCSASVVLILSYGLTLVDSVWSLIFIWIAWNDPALSSSALGLQRFQLIFKALAGLKTLFSLIWYLVKLWMAAGHAYKFIETSPGQYTCKDPDAKEGECGPAKILDEEWFKKQYDAFDFDYEAAPSFVDQWIKLSAAQKLKEAAEKKSPA